MIIQRQITQQLIYLSKQFPVVAVMGPRQSGKTTLARETFPHYTYITLENMDLKRTAMEDPRRFFATYSNKQGVIIDEIQEVPELFSYMQGIVDQSYRPGYFIITGSQNFLMLEKITQTLAGRIAFLTLLPLTVSELEQAGLLPDTLEKLIIKGLYPRLYAQPIDLHIWLSNYINSYVERDVRQVLTITDVLSFQKFLKLCAARVGNILNYADIARDCDISPNTAKAWIGVLQTSYIIKLLYPYYRNFNKRLIKSPKLYFYDPGLVCSLLNIKDSQELYLHPIRGHIFESLIISELFKYRYNQAELPHFYFWRDVQGHEIDYIIEKSFDQTVPVEIKAGMTVTDAFFKGLSDWQKITDQEETGAYIIYAGKNNEQIKQGRIIGWNNVQQMLRTIYATPKTETAHTS